MCHRELVNIQGTDQRFSPSAIALAVVSTEMHAERVVVFGSFVQKQVREWSDLDVVIVMDTDLPFFARSRTVLQQVAPRVTLDLFVYTPSEWAELQITRPFIRDEVIQKGRVVYERSSSAISGTPSWKRY